jgi:hypothetical protein
VAKFRFSVPVPTRFFAVGGAPGRVLVYQPDGTLVADFAFWPAATVVRLWSSMSRRKRGKATLGILSKSIAPSRDAAANNALLELRFFSMPSRPPGKKLGSLCDLVELYRREPS